MTRERTIRRFAASLERRLQQGRHGERTQANREALARVLESSGRRELAGRVRTAEGLELRAIAADLNRRDEREWLTADTLADWAAAAADEQLHERRERAW